MLIYWVKLLVKTGKNYTLICKQIDTYNVYIKRRWGDYK